MARRSPDEDPGDEWISQALKAEADRHEPDRDRIRQRIRDQEAGVLASGDPISVEEYRFRRRADEPFRRSARLLPAAAAAFVVLTAGAIAAVHGAGGPSDASPPVLVGPASAVPDQLTTTEPTTPTASPSPTRPRSTGAGTSKSPAAGPSSSESGTTTENRSRPAIAVTSTRASSGQRVTLSGDNRDWIAAGGAPNDIVRNRLGDQEISGPHDQGNPTSTTTTGPFALSWTGGLSQAGGSGSRSWTTVTGPSGGPETGVQIRVPADKQDGELVLYVGAGGANAQVRTKLSDGKQVVRTVLRPGSGERGFVVKIRFHAAAAQQSLTVDLVGGSGGSISFAAATLR